MKFHTGLGGIFLFLFHLSCSGGGDNTINGGRSAALANASVTYNDEWALFNNIAGIGSLEHASVFISYSNLYNLPYFNKAGIGYVLPVKIGVAGLSIQRFGSNVYNETKIGLGLGHCIRNVSLGLKINYSQIGIEGIGTKNNIVFEFGGISKISRQLYFGAHIFNLNQAKINKEDLEFIPVIMKAGLSYRPTEKIIFNTEIEKQIDFKPSIKCGIEYKIIKSFVLRSGISTRPYIHYFGTGFSNKKYSFDYAFNFHHYLGAMHHISVSYFFKQKNEK
ncbi:MAG: hypothetical protein K2X86_07340 [Cytophagaceae bacterium]|nr:hypothetical protein [Cytophagaceae bacterium]